MSQQDLFVFFGDEDQADYSRGADAVSAVRSHFDELDGYCSPSDDISTEPSHFRAYFIPKEAEDQVIDAFETISDGCLEDDARVVAIQDCLKGIEGLVESLVSVQYLHGALLVAEETRTTNPPRPSSS
jgi:hypothetical protein